MGRYEISLWEDFPDTTSGGTPFLNERKLCIIGSDLMRSRAISAKEPQLVNNVNGTNTLTFKIYYNYLDLFTGKFEKNPFVPLLVNERKVKVFWEDKWYDLIIKKIEEDTSNKSITYTCEDSYITELSKNGYNLSYNTDLFNNIGTAPDLVKSVLQDSGWRFNEEKSDKIIQETEEPVYEITT
jgi:hypothetical protein